MYYQRMHDMKVYFTAPEDGKRLFSGYYKRIYRILQEFGGQHVDDSVIAPFDINLAHQLEIGDADTYAQIYHRHLKCLKEADVAVFECSFTSTALGVLIEKALELGKPTIGLYYDNNPPHFIMAIHNPKFIVKSYDDDNLSDTISLSLQSIKHNMDRRFNFFISPDLLEYVKTQSVSRNITKSAFIRELILHHRSGRYQE